MLYATTVFGGKFPADKRLKGIATCPVCRELLVPKMGAWVTPHWAHPPHALHCDHRWEPESEWHRKWKSFFPFEWQEVPVGNHIADVCTPGGNVIEFQNSSIDSESIRSRESTYQKMFWIINAERFHKNIFTHGMAKNGDLLFRWKRFPKHWYAARKPMYLHNVNSVGFEDIEYETKHYGREDEGVEYTNVAYRDIQALPREGHLDLLRVKWVSGPVKSDLSGVRFTGEFVSTAQIKKLWGYT